MRQFQLDEQIDSSKIFIFQSRNLEERLDVEYYLPKHYDLLKELQLSKYPLVRLKSLSKRIVDGPFGSSVKSDEYVENGIPFIRVADVTNGEGTIRISDLINISKEKHKSIIRSSIHPGDIVIAKTGATMGAASLVPESIPEGNIRGDLAAITINGDLELAQYVTNFINTSIGYNLFWRLNSGSTRGRVVIGNLKEYPIIIPDRKTIIKINKIIKQGRELKEKKENEAQNLFDSINNYLNQKLGIKQLLIDNTLESRIFKTSYKEISGGRFDPYYLKNCIVNTKSDIFEEYTLKTLAKVTKGQSITSDSIVDGEYPVIAGGQTSPYNHNQFNYEGDVITISASGAYAGYVWYHTSPIFASDCSVVKSKNEKIISTEFIFNVLKMKQIELYNLQQGSGQPHVYPSDIEKIKIPVPPLEEQNNINFQILNIKIKAEQLKLEANNAFENAKMEVEKIIMNRGENNE